MSLTLLINATFHTMQKDGDMCNAVLLDGGTIKELFYTSLPNIPSAKIIDLQTAHVVPGFIDSHTHAFEGGISRIGVDLRGATSLKEIFLKLSDASPINGLVFAFGFDDSGIKEKRFPTVEELDSVCPDIPLLLRRVDGHSGMINTAAWKNIPWSSTPPKPGEQLKGMINREAVGWFNNSLDEEGILAAYNAAADAALKSGHTTVHVMVGGDKKVARHYRILQKHLHTFPVEFIPYPQIADVSIAESLGSKRIGGCLLFDGSFGSRTAALKHAYFDKPGNSGRLYQTDEYWKTFFQEANRKGLQISVHAIGDAAISQCLQAYGTIIDKNGNENRHIIVHNELMDDDMIHYESELGVIAVMQPTFDALWGGENGAYAKILGPERAMRCNRFASLQKAGVLVCGSSDWYITDMDAIQGIQAAVFHHNPDERISPFEAVKLYTKNAAYISGDEERLGRIAKGFQADMTILDNDIFSNQGSRVIDIRGIIKKGTFFSCK